MMLCKALVIHGILSKTAFSHTHSHLGATHCNYKSYTLSAEVDTLSVLPSRWLLQFITQKNDDIKLQDSVDLLCRPRVTSTATKQSREQRPFLMTVSCNADSPPRPKACRKTVG